MANAIGKNIQGQRVRLLDGRVFRAEEGFGCYSFTVGTAVFGHYEDDPGTKQRIDGYDVVALVDEPDAPCKPPKGG